MSTSAGRTGKEARWRALMARFKSSGLSVTRFCRRESLSVPSFYYWRARLSRIGGAPLPKPVPARFVDLGLIDARASKVADAPAVEIKLELGAGLVLHVRRG